MSAPQADPGSASSTPETVFLDFADWRRLAKDSPERVKGMGAYFTPSGQEVRVATDVPAAQTDYVRDFVITTSSQDRYDDVIDVEGWDWKDYFLGGDGVVLLAHDRRSLPMGKCPWIKPIANALVGRCHFPTQAEVGYDESEPSLWKTVRLLYINRFMKNTSVGLMPVEWTWDEETGGLHFIKQKGLEWSLCSVPANPECYQLAKSAGIDVNPVREWAMRSLDAMVGVEGVYVSRDRLEKALRALGSEKGLRYFDTGEILMATKSVERSKAPTPVKSGWVPEEKAKSKGGGKVARALKAAGLSIEDLIASALSLKEAKNALAAAPVPEPVAPLVLAASIPDDQLFLEIEESEPANALILVDDQGRALDINTESLTTLVRGAFTDAFNNAETRVTGKVY